MKQGWEIKKLGEVFDLQMGKTPSRDNGDYWGGDNVWVAISDLQDKYIGESKEHITDKALTETKIKKVKAGTTIMSFKLSVGRAAITTQDLYTNEAIMAFNLNEGYDLIADYIYYYLKGYKWQGVNKAVMGLTLNKASISQNYIAIPPRAEQERIVAELDCLSGIIEKKKQQLKELDTLAQSIFYQMFGDPISNEKGWEVKKLGEVCISDLGKTLDSKKNKGNLYNYLCSINVQWGYFDLTTLKEMRLEESELERYSVKQGDLLICEGGDTGRCAIWNSEELMYYQNALHRIRFIPNTILPILCQYIMLYMKQNGEIDKYSKGQTIKHLVKSTLMSIPFIIPPITLQQEFAEKIEAIEKQKELIKQSITQTEELFNARMDYYFN